MPNVANQVNAELEDTPFMSQKQNYHSLVITSNGSNWVHIQVHSPKCDINGTVVFRQLVIG